MLIWIAVAVMAGVVLGDGWPGAPLWLGVLGGAALGAGWRLGRRWPRLGLALALLGWMLLGVWRGSLSRPDLGPDSLPQRVGQQVTLEARVAEEPRWGEEHQRVVVAVLAVRDGPQRWPTSGRTLLELPPEPRLLPGAQILVAGELAAPRSGRGFDYAGYLARREIFVVLAEPRLLALSDPPPGVRVALLRLKTATHAALLRLVPEPEAALLCGILLGMQSALPADVKADFATTGTSHVLVISGWNISVTIVGAMALASRVGLRRWPATLLALGAVVLYVLLVGPTAAVVRSAIMGGVAALAAPLGRRADAWTALAAACLAMCLIDPHTLWDLGFQLSAGAVAGLFGCGAAATAWGQRLLRPRWLAWAVEPLAATLAAQVFTLPLLLYHFGRLSLVSPLANVLLLPAVPLAMALGGLLAVAALGLGGLALPLAFVAWLPLAWMTRGAALLARLPYAEVAVPPLPLWTLLAYQAAVVGWLLWSADRAAAAVGAE